MSLAAVLDSAAIFGFFYAWICSTMWGLDAASPDLAISAMQAMNASVRNATFAVSFFGTVPLLALAGVLCFLASARRSAIWFGAAMLVYAIGGMALTMAINVPMNEALAEVVVSNDMEENRRIWQDYSPAWQFWNTIRTVFSGLAAACAATGFFFLGRGLKAE